MRQVCSSTGLWILQDNNLANPYGEIQTDQGSVSIHDQGMRLLPGHLLVSACCNYRDGHAEEDTLASADCSSVQDSKKEYFRPAFTLHLSFPDLQPDGHICLTNRCVPSRIMNSRKHPYWPTIVPSDLRC